VAQQQSPGGPGDEAWRAGGLQTLLLALAASAALAGATPGRARAGLLRRRKRRAPPPAGRELDEAVNELVALYWPILQNLGFSGCAGYASAYALKASASRLAPCPELAAPPCNGYILALYESASLDASMPVAYALAVCS